MKLKLIKLALAFLTFIYSTLNVMAAPEDHGRWYSLDDDESSSMSPLGFIIGGIVICFLGYILISANNYDKEKNGNTKNDNGCLIMAIIGGIICIIVSFSRCGG